MKRKICHFTIAHLSEDERIFHKECKTLAKYYDVSLVTTCNEKKAIEGIKFIGIGLPKGAVKRTIKIFSIIPILLRQKCELYHFHDPELIFTGYILKRIFKKKVVYDAHEHYTEKMKSRNINPRWFKNMILRIWNWTEIRIAKRFDLVITADPFTVTQFPAERAIVIGNYPTLHFIDGVANISRSVKEEEFRIVYLGTIHESRGLKISVEAIEKVKYPLIKLHIIGGSKYEDLTNLFLASKRVVYHGRIPWELVNTELNKCAIGLALLQPVPAFLYCPGENIVKLFEYAGLGIPYIISNFERLNLFVKENGGGLTVDPTNVDEIARQIERLYEDKILYERLSEEGAKMVRTKYNWEAQEEKLVEAYKKILK